MGILWEKTTASTRLTTRQEQFLCWCGFGAWLMYATDALTPLFTPLGQRHCTSRCGSRLPLLIFAATRQDTQQEQQESLGILSWNVLNPAYVKSHLFRQSHVDDLLWSRRIKRISQRIRNKENADIVCWQEVPSPPLSSSSSKQRAPRRATRVFSPLPQDKAKTSDPQDDNDVDHPWDGFHQHIVQDLGYTVVTAIPHVTQTRQASAKYMPHPSICAVAFSSQKWEIVRAESGSHSVLCLLRERCPPTHNQPNNNKNNKDDDDYFDNTFLDQVLPRATNLESSVSAASANYLLVASLHLERGAENDVKRLEQMRKVSLRIERTLQDFQTLLGDTDVDSDCSLPLVLAGDFNLERNSILHQWLRAVSPVVAEAEAEEDDGANAKNDIEHLLQQQPRLADMFESSRKKARTSSGRWKFASLLPLRDVYLDHEASSSLGQALTEPTGTLSHCAPLVDYIFVTRNISIRQCLPTCAPQRSWPSEENPSDHALIGVEIEWPPA